MDDKSYIIITKSSAGSGKTFNLSLRFLHTLLNINNNDNQNNIKNILAITFTNKATFEMQQRIISWMKLICLDGKIKDVPILHILKSPLKLQKFFKQNRDSLLENKNFLLNFTDTAIKKIMENNLLHILQYFNDFKVSTIDSFNTFILKALSFRLQLAPDFEVVLDPDTYFNAVLEELYQDITDNENIREIFDEYIKHIFYTSPNDLKWDINNTIKANINYLWSKEKETGKRFLFKDTSNTVNLEGLREKFILFVNQIKSLTDPYKVKKQFITALDKAVSIESGKIDYTKLKTWLPRELNEDSDDKKGLLKKGSAEIPDNIKQLYDFIKLEIAKSAEYRAQFKFNSVKNIYKLFQKKLDVIMKKNKILLINELNFKLKELLTNNNTEDILPELYYYLSEKYNHYLIDEFQDTSVLQWENIEYLINESFSEGGTLFVVGDEKQAIYRWRGGHREIVREIEKKYFDNRYPAAESLYKLSLDTNYRSNEQIINFVNKKFSFENIKFFLQNYNKLEVTDDQLIAFEDVEQNITDNNKNKGYVYAEIIKPDKENNTRAAAEKILKEKLKIKLKELLVDYSYDYRDIAILCFKNEEIRKVVEWLLEFKSTEPDKAFKEINIESAETISIKSHPIVNDIIYFLKFLNTPTDNLSVLNFLSGVIFRRLTGLSLNDIRTWYNRIFIDNKDIFLYKELQKWQPEFWENYISEFIRKISYIPLYEFVQLIIHKWDLFNAFPADAPYFLKFLEVVFNMTETAVNNVNEMLEEWTDKDDKEFVLKVAENLNAIKLMTVHSSKGLEFPVVVLPFLDTKPQNSNWFADADNDNLNLYYITGDDTIYSEKLKKIYTGEKIRESIDKINSLYVATTRAKEALIMFFLSYKQSDKYKNLFFNDKEDIIMQGKLIKKVNGVEKIPLPEQLNFSNIKEIELQWMDLLKFKIKPPFEISHNEFTAIKLGDAVHRVLSLIKIYPDKNIRKNIEITARQTDVPVDKLGKIIDNFFRQGKFLEFFKPDEEVRIYNEFEVINKFGALKRIDRLMIYNDKIKIIDYKTGEEYKEKHYQQIIEYKNIIREIYPDKNIECYLLYIDEQKIREVK